MIRHDSDSVSLSTLHSKCLPAHALWPSEVCVSVLIGDFVSLATMHVLAKMGATFVSQPAQLV